jgi:hypothetical protein
MKMKNKLGIDIGKVIMEPVNSGSEDTTFISGSYEDAMKTMPSPGAIERISQLVEIFEGRVYLVSKCGKRVRALTNDWLSHWNFFEKTKINPEHLYYCFKRDEKAPICENLGITHFIDDRLDCLEPMKNIVSYRYLFGEQIYDSIFPEEIIRALNWDETFEKIIKHVEIARDQY